METEMIPYLRSFITLRHERFGAILFNRYLGLEEELDPIEAYTAALADGRNSVALIEEGLRQKFGLSPRKATAGVEKLLAKLSGIFALGYRRSGGSTRLMVPDLPAFPDDGPRYCAPKSVIWDVTYACNLKCPHCLTSSGAAQASELDTAGAKKLLDALAAAKILTLSLSGGEPFLRPDIVEILEHACARNMRVDVASNGILLPDEIVAALRRLPVFQVQISLDGIGEQHDRFRGMEGAFERSCQNVRRLVEEGIAVSVSTTATSENVDALEGLIELTLSLGCTGYKAIPFVSAGRGASNDRLRLSTENFRLMSMVLETYARKLEGKMTVSTESGFSFLLNGTLPLTEEGENGPMGCSAGYDILNIAADGTAFPCPFLHDFPLGDIVSEGVTPLWFQSAVLQRLRTIRKQEMGGACNNCRYAPMHCRGGCRAAAYLETGDLLAGDPTCFMTSAR